MASHSSAVSAVRRRKSPVRARKGLPHRTLWIDLGGVVVRDPRPIVVEALARRGGAPRPALRRAYYRLSRLLDRGRIDLSTMYRRLERSFPFRMDFREFRDWVERRSLNAVPRVIPALRALHRRGRVRIVFASNVSLSVWNGVRRRFRLRGLAKDVVLSYRVGVLKPEPAFFREAIRRTRPKETPVLYLDDAAVNVRSARRLGIDARRVTRPDQIVTLLRRLR